MIGRVGARGTPEWNVEGMTDPAVHLQRAALAVGLAAGVAVPLLVGHEVAGVLEFYASAPLAPAPTLLDALTQLGIQLGRAVERERAAVYMDGLSQMRSDWKRQKGKGRREKD